MQRGATQNRNVNVNPGKMLQCTILYCSARAKVNGAMAQPNDKEGDSRRGTDPAEELYLARVGERMRLMRTQLGMSRKMLSLTSGVSERYLAEMERGAGNASLLVVRRLAAAMGMRVSELAAEEADQPVELQQAISTLEQLAPADLAAACAWLSRLYDGTSATSPNGRIAFVGMSGAGKKTLGRALATAIGVPFIVLDGEIERKCGMPLAQVLAARGQAGFERLEFECLEQVLAAHSRCVIVTGASLVAEPRTYDLLLSSCFVVWLRATSELQTARAAAQAGRRSVALNQPALAELGSALLARSELYGRANATLDTSAITEQEALEQLLTLTALRG